MRIAKIYVSLFLIISFFLLSCSTVPVTGRKQLIIIPSTTMLSTSFKQYDEFLKTNKLSNNQEQTQMVKKVGRRIQKAVEKYFAEKKYVLYIKRLQLGIQSYGKFRSKCVGYARGKSCGL